MYRKIVGCAAELVYGLIILHGLLDFLGLKKLIVPYINEVSIDEMEEEKNHV
jgi:hypothetical protein